MKLELKSAKKRKLEITRPDGTELVLVPKVLTVKQTIGHERNMKKLKARGAAGELTQVEQALETIGMSLENYNVKDFEDLQMDHLNAIIEKLLELVRTKDDDEEKKTPE